MCNMGGRIEPTETNERGMQSRWLIFLVLRTQICLIVCCAAWAKDNRLHARSNHENQYLFEMAEIVCDIAVLGDRSLMAAYELVQMGFDNICVLKGGFNEWSKSGR